MIFFSEILNLEGHQNCCIGSKVMTILLNGWILPNGGALSWRVFACSLRSRLVYIPCGIKEGKGHQCLEQNNYFVKFSTFVVCFFWVQFMHLRVNFKLKRCTCVKKYNPCLVNRFEKALLFIEKNYDSFRFLITEVLFAIKFFFTKKYFLWCNSEPKKNI